MGLRIIGAGFGRTGTLSLKTALERLLGAPCYHMAEVYGHPEHAEVWRRAAEGEAVDFERVLKGYAATVDWPACEFWRELMEAYPDAKVLLSVRDPDKWYSSFQATIEPLLRRGEELRAAAEPGQIPPELDALGAMAEAVLVERSFGGRLGERADFIAAFARHNTEVQSGVDPDRLLVFDVAQGWDPLAEFLDVPVPDEPFPNVNDRAMFQALFGFDEGGEGGPRLGSLFPQTDPGSAGSGPPA